MATVIEDTRALIDNLRLGKLDQLSALAPLLDALEAELDFRSSLLSIQKELDSLKKSVQQLQSGMENRVRALEDSLVKQTDQLFLSDEEHKQMVKHVHGVLDLLEDYLRRHT